MFVVKNEIGEYESHWSEIEVVREGKLAEYLEDKRAKASDERHSLFVVEHFGYEKKQSATPLPVDPESLFGCIGDRVQIAVLQYPHDTSDDNLLMTVVRTENTAFEVAVTRAREELQNIGWCGELKLFHEDWR